MPFIPSVGTLIDTNFPSVSAKIPPLLETLSIVPFSVILIKLALSWLGFWLWAKPLLFPTTPT